MKRIVWMLFLLRDVCIVPIVLVLPRRQRKIVFGAWSGRQFGCNPKYLFEYVVRRGGFDCVWIGNEILKRQVLAVPGARFARKGSLIALYHCLTARFLVSNVNCYDDIGKVPNCGRAIIVYTSHGYPDKKAENQLSGHGVSSTAEQVSGIRNRLRCLLIRLQKFMYPRAAWSSASSQEGDRLRVEGQPSRLHMDRMLHAGTPRADFIVKNASNSSLRAELRSKYAKLLGVTDKSKWVLFVPTWRHDENYLFSFSKSALIDKWQEFLEKHNVVIIEKQHPKTIAGGFIAGGMFGSIVVVDVEQNAQIDTQELLLASDVLITDYSSIYYDFYLMNRPCIHFIYDYEHAVNQDFGFDFNLLDYGGGPFVRAEALLFNYIAMPEKELLRLRSPMTASHLSYEQGRSCEAYYDFFVRMRR